MMVVVDIQVVFNSLSDNEYQAKYKQWGGMNYFHCRNSTHNALIFTGNGE